MSVTSRYWATSRSSIRQKETAAEAIRLLRDHGVVVKVLTGDNDAVARHVCRQVALPIDTVLVGEEVAALGDAELATRVEATALFARLAPQQKARVLRALLPLSPLAPALGLTRLPPGYRVVLVAILAAYLTLTQLVKTWVMRRFRLE